ncbi:VOC family protein [Nocardia sp. AB354]|uniref:VOC family protein n=1 Tax=Nocardia sp. AB354 TaxID=3413283 RepID=UPI003C15A02F
MRLNQVTVGSTDLDRAEHFYLLLGLHLIVKTEHWPTDRRRRTARHFSCLLNSAIKSDGAGRGAAYQKE